MLKNKRILTSLWIPFLLIMSHLCGNTVQSGWTSDYDGSVVVDGLKRTYHVYLPNSQDKPLPLVFLLHGGGGSAKAMEKLTQEGFNALAEKEGFIVVYPEAVEKHWNDGRALQRWLSQREKIDDIGFLSALIEHLSREHRIDKRRIYATGISNGGLMSYRLACELTYQIAAIAAVASSMGENLSLSCSPSRPISVLIINGIEDPLVPWEGGEIRLGPWGLGRVLSTSNTVKFWVGRNLCASSPLISWEPDRDPQDGTRVRKEVYASCRKGTEVILYAVIGGGHTWPGGYQYLGEWIVGKTSRDIDANEVIWGFFKKHELK